MEETTSELTQHYDGAFISILEEMDNKYGFDILGKGEDGRSVIDEQKLTELYQSVLLKLDEKRRNK